MLEIMVWYLCLILTIKFFGGRKHHKHHHRPRPVRIAFYIDGKEKDETMAQLIKDDKKYTLAVQGFDAHGNPVATDPAEAAVFSLNDDSFGAITPNGDGSFTFESSGKLGGFSIQCQDDGLSGSLECEAVAGALASISVSVTEQP